MASQPRQDAAQVKATGAEGASLITSPTLTLLKGGGAIRGMGEKFSANPVTGTGSMSVPIATSPGRSGFGPQLSLSYDSGAGNGPFGLGWNLSLPAITRKTDKGLPQYKDGDESDVFILSGAEDLVPEFEKDDVGTWVLKDGKPVIDDKPRVVTGVLYKIRRYRPRIEGLFARIERWVNQTEPNDTFWRSISKDNITTWYGKSDNSRIVDPSDASRIFSWIICQSYDDKGNAIVYEYKSEDSERICEDQQGQFVARPHEQNRTDDTRKANRYLKRIYYGNRDPHLPNLEPHRPWPDPPSPGLSRGQPNWLFEVVFDYDDGHYAEDLPDGAGRVFARSVHSPPITAKWKARVDPFSTYRAGFEVRTYRLCQRALMFHHFPNELGTPDCLVRSTDFTYSAEDNPNDSRSPVYALLTAVGQSGYVSQADGSYVKQSPPPIEFEYTQPIVQDKVEEVDSASLKNLPIGLDGEAYQWIDLHGEGIPGILSEQTGVWFYKRNFSPIGKQAVEFSSLERIAIKPNLALGGGAQFMDFAGDGQPDLAVLGGPMPGLYEHDKAEGWQPFRTFTARPNRDVRDPNVKFVDLDGDGHADVLITEDDAFVWHKSLAEEGFGPARRVAQVLDEEKGPRVVFADGTQSIYLADLSGDGLTDLVRIRNGEICYWPNLGYGRFGAKVTMDQSPHFDQPDRFDHKRIRLADIDGSGTTDIIYLHDDGIRLYFNQSGNAWSRPRILDVLPRVDDVVSIMPTDLVGNGTACLVWSSPLPGEAGRQMRYVNLMGGQKPHLLIRSINNLGAETCVQYATSVKFYLQDKRDGKPWITRLPFPVHVVERIEAYDHISRNRFVTCYAYHHGYFDGVEREFRGFGMVEQWDTEEFAALSSSGRLTAGANIEDASHVPPVLTKTWFHTGVYDEIDEVSQHFAAEYYGAPESRNLNYQALFDVFFKTLLPDTILPSDLTLDEEREACRALKGAMLRQEVYALDGTAKAEHPYTVTEQNFTMERVQPKSDNRHGVFFTHFREAISYHYERHPVDPRVQHALTLEVDVYGNVIKSLAIGYGRRRGQSPLEGDDKKKQEQMLITYTENKVTNPIDDAVGSPDEYRTPLSCETRTYEVTGFELVEQADRFAFNDIAKNGCELLHTLPEIQYEEPTDYSKKQKRLIEHVRTLYRPNDLGVSQSDPLALLPLGAIQSLALPGESYRLAFTPGLAEGLLVDSGKLSKTELHRLLAEEGKYVQSEDDANWWIPSGRVFLSPNSNDTAAQEITNARQHFFLPRRYRNPFHSLAISTESLVIYDGYDLLMLETRDPLGNRVTAGERKPDGTIDPDAPGHDYRVLQPRLMMDPNRNRSAVAFDVLGMVGGTAVMGKPEEASGDSLDGFEADLTETVLRDHLANPLAAPHAILGQATTRLVYDLFAYSRTKNTANPEPAVVYTLARETHEADLAPGQQTKIQHSFSFSDGFGREIQKKIQSEPGPVPQRDAGGKIIVGTDGQPERVANEVSPRWVGSGWTIFNNKGKPVRQYEPFFTDTHRFEFDVRIGVSPVLFYDPIERVVATLHPNHTYEKVVFEPWQQKAYDVNDTVTFEPQSDEDVKGLFVHPDGTSRLPITDYLPTWYAQRQAGGLGAEEQGAARKAAIHAATPIVAHADSLGRTFLAVTHNKFKYSEMAASNPPVDDFYCTRINLDVEGNQREVIDAKGRIVMRYDYDMLSNRIHQISMEAGERWMLNDVARRPLYAWDSRDHRVHTAYDQLRRPTDSFLREGAGAELLVGRYVYGESRSNPETTNLRGKVVQVFDQAGIVTSDQYDFKGNLLSSTRRLLQHYKAEVDWSQSPALEGEAFTGTTTYDALNRPVAVTSPDGSIYRPAFNGANLLDTVYVNLRGEAHATLFVTSIDYNAKGQRERIDYGNGTSTTYAYDPNTFRLIHLRTTRTSDHAALQDLHYTYDPTCNITHIRDDAQQTIYFKNTVVEPHADYSYDAIYRLIEATGREHLGQSGGTPIPHSDNDAPRVAVPHPGDGNVMGTYVERYVYDAVGNFIDMLHRGINQVNPGWTRTYRYDEASLIEPAKQSNRLSSTQVGNGTTAAPEPYAYDAHGNMLRMPHLPVMQWDFKDQLQMTQRQAVSAEEDDGAQHQGERTWYVYDAGGHRVRKVTERQAAAGEIPTRMKERLYLGGFEVYREYENDGMAVSLERETLHIMDDQQRIALVETKTVDAPHSALTIQHLIRYQLSNHLGSASLELDHEAQIISYEEYTPYGSTSYQAVRSQTETPKRYRYTGKERDEESGFCYHGARYYTPWLNRWTSCDPAGLVDGPNLYVYARVQPTRLVDPNGNQGEPKNVKINDVVPYDVPLKDRASIGVNPQKDHVIAKGKQRLINPRINTSKQLTVVQETGAATGGAAARPHTQATRADVVEIKRLRQLNPEDWASFQKDIVSPSLEPRYRAGYSQSATNISALDEIGSMFEVDQPLRAPNSSFPALDWSKSAAPVGPPVDLRTGEVIKTGSRPSSGQVLGRVVGGAAIAGMGGAAITQLYEGKPGDALKTVGIGTVVYKAIERYPALLPLTVMASTISAYDERVQEHANSAGSWVEEKVGSRNVGAVAASGTAVGEALFEGTFGAVGTAIGEGLAAIWLFLTSSKTSGYGGGIEDPAERERARIELTWIKAGYY